MKYLFTVALQGSGETEAEAWQEAIAVFAVDPGEPATVRNEDEDNTTLFCPGCGDPVDYHCRNCTPDRT